MLVICRRRKPTITTTWESLDRQSLHADTNQNARNSSDLSGDEKYFGDDEATIN